MGALMPPQVAQAAAGKGAVGTAVGLLASVGAGVSRQVDELGRGVGAAAAAERLLPAVRLHVPLQVARVVGHEGAETARVQQSGGQRGPPTRPSCPTARPLTCRPPTQLTGWAWPLTPGLPWTPGWLLNFALRTQCPAAPRLVVAQPVGKSRSGPLGVSW